MAYRGTLYHLKKIEFSVFKIFGNSILSSFLFRNLIFLNGRSDTLDTELDYKIYSDSKKLPKEYLILQLRMSLNKELLEAKIISYEVFSKMQNLLIKRMDKIILENIE